MKRLLWMSLGMICLFFALVPALLYFIINVGVIVLFLVGSALFLYGWRGYRCPPRLRAAFRWLVGIGAVGALCLSGLMIWFGWLNPPPPDGTDAVVVLGSKVVGDQPSRMLARRLNAASRYLHANPEVLCVVSGGQGADEEYPEAEVMASYLMDRGIAPERILIEDRSTNTRENLDFSALMLQEAGVDVGHITIATDGFHQMRAAMMAADSGLFVSSVSCHSPWGLYPSYWVREWFGIAHVAVFGRA